MKNRFVNPYSILSRSVIFIPLFILPFIFWFNYRVPYELPRVIATNRLIEVLIIIGLIKINTLSAKRFNFNLFLTIIGFVLVATVASVMGADWNKSLWGNYYRMDGLLTLYHLAGLSILVTLYWHPSWKKILVTSSAFGSVLISIWAIVVKILSLLSLNNGLFMWGSNVSLSFGNPNFLAGYLAVSLPALFYLLSVSTKNKLSRVLLIVGIIAQTIATFLTGSIAGLIGVILSISLWSFFTIKKSRGLGLLLGILFSLGIVAWWLKDLQVTGFVAEGRERIVRNILLGVKNKPYIGYGWANVDYAFESGDWPIQLMDDVYLDKAHSILLEVLATTGIVGLVFYILIIVQVFIYLLNKSRLDKYDRWTQFLLTTLLIYLIHSQLNVISIMEELYFWIILGIVCNQAIQLPKRVSK